MNEENIPFEPVKGTPTSPDVAHWLSYERKVREETPKRLEDAAKFLAGMVSITFTIFVRLDVDAFKGASAGLLYLTVICWLLSLGLAFLVIFPVRFKYASQSAESISIMHKRVVERKYVLFVSSVVLFMVALALTAIMFFSRLTFTPPIIH